MALCKQAKVLTKQQTQAMLALLERSRDPLRNTVIFLLSLRAGLRAKEIAHVTWTMVTCSGGDIASELALRDEAAKGRSGRVIPLSGDLQEALRALRQECLRSGPDDRIIRTARRTKTTPQVIVNLFKAWYGRLGFEGCSSHSGRRTFITNAARRISTVGGSLRDVQSLAGHSSLSTTQRYIEVNNDAKRRVVEMR